MFFVHDLHLGMDCIPRISRAQGFDALRYIVITLMQIVYCRAKISFPSLQEYLRLPKITVPWLTLLDTVPL